MPVPTNLPSELASYLRDEAYVALCQDSILEAVADIERQKKEILSTRPPFGVLATKKSRQVFEKSLRTATHNEAELRNRLDQLSQLALWLRGEIEQSLQAYLPEANVEYRCCLDASAAVAEWEQAASALHDITQALARDSRAVIAALNPVPVGNAPLPSALALEQTRLRMLGNLRITVVAMQVGIDETQAIRTRFTQLCANTADGLQLPLITPLRSDAWVDQVALLSAQRATAELLRCETEAREFHAVGLISLLRSAAEIREACIDAAKAILAQEWRRLHGEFIAQIADEREVDDVITEISKRRNASDLRRHQGRFEAAKMARLS